MLLFLKSEIGYVFLECEEMINEFDLMDLQFSNGKNFYSIQIIFFTVQCLNYVSYLACDTIRISPLLL